jgi:hypothetical protein
VLYSEGRDPAQDAHENHEVLCEYGSGDHSSERTRHGGTPRTRERAKESKTSGRGKAMRSVLIKGEPEAVPAGCEARWGGMPDG